MKIAFLSFYSGIIERGVEIWVSELAKRLKKNHEIFIYQSEKSIQEDYIYHIPCEVDWKKKSLANITHRFYLDYYSRKIYTFTKKAISAIDKEDIDIIIPTNGGWQSFLVRLYTKLKNKKIIICGHSGIGWDDFINIMIRPDTFVALTEYQKEWAKKISFGVRIEKIPDGVDLEQFSPKGRKISLPFQKPIILLVSSLSFGKRVDLAIKAVSKLNRGSLIILGCGNPFETEKIKKLGNKLLGDKRFFLTTVSHEETPLWYRASDLVTFPSWRREAFGIVLLEAMACNKPVVTSSDPAKKEIIGQAGYLCNPQNIEEYSQALKNALHHDFGNIPRQQAEKFSWDCIVNQYEQLFKSL